MSNVVIKTLSDMTDDEISAMKEVSAQAEATERHRPLSESEVLTMLLKQKVNILEVDDQTAFRMKAFYPAWEAGYSCSSGYKVQHNGRLWRCVQAHTTQDGWEPSISAASLWEEICKTHDGSRYDPIPYDGSMALENGKYYSQGGVTYLCSRDTVNPVYNTLRELVGIYVEEVRTSLD